MALFLFVWCRSTKMSEFQCIIPGENDPIWRSYFSNGLVQPPTRLPLFCFQTCLALESYQPVEGVFLDGTFGLIAMLGSCCFCRFPKHDAPLSTFTIPDKNMSIYLQKSCPRTTHIYYLRKKKGPNKDSQLKPSVETMNGLIKFNLQDLWTFSAGASQKKEA